MNANVLLIDLKPIVYQWFTPEQANDSDLHMAIDDLATWATSTAVEQECDTDLIGPTFFLVNSGWQHDQLQAMIDTMAKVVRTIYLTQSTPEWRSAGVKRIQVDQFYLMTVKLGIDPYV
ncbi:hypothetical protein FDJ23_gp212 [Erwinia phage vB_EamM_Desertfox]|jgi:hypothetical protein|uniref:Uncharacterized protein n=6 Tax=Agricanvirus TaxID=1984776 RepID=A0A191ZCB3_9CAUD|nr:hypothetical protein FDH97_gp217 [Erwinia phage vB_EamM_Deimos-Minion]YP_009606320.1 hypothetical protein FDI00_gp214 [Erwinia phage vB_EamM_Special G]YP_009621953.1 hypothetical protein FDJ23_gp212 [Erwinia phage vB_EamM_Desertfox]AUG86642.1 hypothetical protein MADMEL_214 [Erwinia phage vB_EamM_MadMel]AUG86965.1 hypothetical protein MORTIMER_217 [Erwinia phage vB_EamM_Mortimer]QBP07319.1 hypothetical protein REBECCA_214 [Erwinia phage Rebecca]ANH52317.1 hypothetical protein DM_217 [Erwin